MLYALCGISNSGKTTVLEATLQRAPYLARLVTSTTRPPRSGERAGRDYHFLTPAQFQARINNGLLVCPIEYRGEWYATALADLRACSRQETLAVLRPDKLAALEVYTPLVGIYLEMLGQQEACAPEDQIILDHQAACSLRLTNIPGHLDQVVTTLLTLLHAPASGMGAGRLV
jgi:guanylate kinase